MMLYDIYYPGSGVDFGIPLPTYAAFQRRGGHAPQYAVAICRNSDGHALYRCGRAWKAWRQLSATQRATLRRRFPASRLLPGGEEVTS